MMNKFLVSCLLLLAGCSASAQQPSFITRELDQYIREGMKDWNIPGLAICIVKDGKVVLQKGYGVRDTATQEPVDENTLFIIASNSKLFTGTALAQLEYNKKLSLNDRITRYFPDFRLYDSVSTQLVTIRDMLCHRIGTKTFQGDFTFWDSKLSRHEIMYKMRYLKPTGLFRQDYGYCNSCFLTAGEVIPLVTNKPWEVYVYDSILMPLGMNNTHMLTAGMDQRENVARPYSTQFTGSLAALNYDHVDNLGPATSMVSNVKDLSQWLLMQLDSGRLNGKQVLPWAVLQKTRDMNIFTGSRKSAVFPVHFKGYGLGVQGYDYNGRQVYSHTGGAFGFVTGVCTVPEEKLGICILTNNDNQHFFELLRYQILDAYTQLPFTNRSKNALPAFKEEMQQTLKGIAALRARVQHKQPPVTNSEIMGKYSHPLYGEIYVSGGEKPGQLLVNFEQHPALKATLDYMDGNQWLLEYNDKAYGIFPATIDKTGGRLQLTLKANDFVEYDPYTFTKD
jgi:CubicO group peptidase (beta-lactamase class C family)